jgi:hypothetical protein
MERIHLDRAQPSGVLFQVLTAEVNGPDDVWVAGMDRTGGGFATAVGHWDGLAWTFTMVPEGNKGLDPWAIHKTPEGEVWVAGRVRPTSTTDRLSVARFDGHSWSTVDFPADLAVGRLITGSSGDLWITGSTRGRPSCGFSLHSTGAGFTRSDVCAPATTDGVDRILPAKDGDTWYAGVRARWTTEKVPGGSLSKWTGSAWQSIPGPYPATRDVQEITAIPGGGLWVVAEGTDAAGKWLTPQLWRTTGSLG